MVIWETFWEGKSIKNEHKWQLGLKKFWRALGGSIFANVLSEMQGFEEVLEGSGTLLGRFLEGFEGLLGRFFDKFWYLFEVWFAEWIFI